MSNLARGILCTESVLQGGRKLGDVLAREANKERTIIIVALLYLADYRVFSDTYSAKLKVVGSYHNVALEKLETDARMLPLLPQWCAWIESALSKSHNLGLHKRNSRQQIIIRDIPEFVELAKNEAYCKIARKLVDQAEKLWDDYQNLLETRQRRYQEFSSKFQRQLSVEELGYVRPSELRKRMRAALAILDQYFPE